MSSHILINTILCLLFSLLLGCGKKTISKDDGLESDQQEQETVDAVIARQNVTCAQGQSCPSGVAKVVSIFGKKISYCTGFLINDSTLATSSSCIPDLIRQNGQSCSKDIFFFFPATSSIPEQKIGCEKVIFSSHLSGRDPLLWRDNLVFLKLKEPRLRYQSFKIDRGGVQDGKKFTTWALEQLDETTGIIKRSTCESLHNTFINPLASSKSSPVLLFSDCATTLGISGAPLIDSFGRVRALVSEGMDSKLRNYLSSTGLLVEPLKDMLHATNFACAPTPYDSGQLEPMECLKDLDYETLDSLRASMLSNEEVFGKLITKYEASIKNSSKYIQLGLKLISQGDQLIPDIFPRCFNPINNWIHELPSKNSFTIQATYPLKSFKRSMNSRGRIFGVDTDLGKQKISLRFSPKNLRGFRRSFIVLINEQGEERVFNNKSENCDLLF